MSQEKGEDTLIGRVVDGRFRLVRQLGAGGMGAVYLAEQVNLKREVAIKVLKPGIVDEAFRTRFKAEAMATSRLNHPNIITVHDFGIDTGAALPLPWLALEKLDGQSLRERLSARGRLSVGEGVAVLIGICSALIDAHAAGIIHRDLKPENVFLVDRKDGAVDVKVLDFGIAKILDLDGSHTQTQSGIVVGTPGYVAPERMQTGHEDARGDLYALGVVAFEVFGGRAPFEAPTPLALSLKHMLEPPPHLNELVGVEVPDAVDAFVASLLSKTADGRPAGARAARDALRALETTRPQTPGAPNITAPTGATPLPPLPQTPRRSARPLLAVVVAAVVVGGVVVGSGVWLDDADRGARAAARGDFPSAASAWWSACRDQDAAACGSLGNLVADHPEVVDVASLKCFSSADAGVSEVCRFRFNASGAWRQGCAGGDAPSCLAFARETERSFPNFAQVMEAAHAYEKACKAGLLLACFHAKVLEIAGADSSGRMEGGTISVTAAERAAAEADCDLDNTAACFALSLIDVRLARIDGRLDHVVALRKRWHQWCEPHLNHGKRESFGPACSRLWPTAEAKEERRLGDEARDPAVAEGHHRAALLLYPEYAEPLYALAALAVAQRRDDDALAFLRRAFAIEPTLRRDIVGDTRFDGLRATPGFAALRGE